MHIKNKKNYFIGTKTSWVIQNNSLSLECINKINKRKNDKHISIFDFSSIYTKIPHDKLLAILCKVFLDFMFKGGTRYYIVINNLSCTSGSSKKRRHQFVFSKPLLKETIKILLHTVFSLLEIS